MRLLRVLVTSGVIWACGSSSKPSPSHGGAHAAGGRAGGSASGTGGEGDESGGTGGSSDERMELTLDVLERGADVDQPAVGVSVLVEGVDTAVEVLTDANGRAVAKVDPSDAPWDVTIARAGSVPVSVIGVTESLENPLFLSPTSSQAPVQSWVFASMQGSIEGRTLPSSHLVLASSTPVTTLAEDERSYVAGVRALPGASSIHLLVTERDDDEAILNAMWLDVPWTGSDLTQDILLPSSPRTPSERTVLVDVPTTGAVTAKGLSAPPQRVVRIESHFGLDVGTMSVAAEPKVDGRFRWQIAALDGDMAPTLSLTLKDATDEHEVVITDLHDDESSVSVLPADALAATGSTVDTLSLAWSAPLHSHVGASVRRVDGEAGRWYLYSSGGTPPATHRWPRLPSAVSLADVGLAADTDLRVYVFGLTVPSGDSPWDWSKRPGTRGVVRGYGHAIASPDGSGTAGASGAAGAGGSG